MDLAMFDTKQAQEVLKSIVFKIKNDYHNMSEFEKKFRSIREIFYE